MGRLHIGGIRNRMIPVTPGRTRRRLSVHTFLSICALCILGNTVAESIPQQNRNTQEQDCMRGKAPYLAFPIDSEVLQQAAAEPKKQFLYCLSRLQQNRLHNLLCHHKQEFSEKQNTRLPHRLWQDNVTGQLLREIWDFHE